MAQTNIVTKIKVCIDKDDNNNITWSEANIGSDAKYITCINKNQENDSLKNVLKDILDRLNALENPQTEEEQEEPIEEETPSE